MNTPPPDTRDIATPPPDDEAACRLAAKRLRERYPRWVLIWVARTARYHANPLASSWADAGLTDTQPAGLAVQIEQAERAASSRAADRRPADVDDLSG